MMAMSNSSEDWDRNDDKNIDSISSSAGLLNELPSKSRAASLRKYIDLRLIFEGFLVFCLFITLVSITHKPNRSNAVKESSYGPTLPRKPVIFGNTAGFGPDIPYNDPEMLRNSTRMREIHRNWHTLFPPGRGYVIVSENEEFEVLHPPFKMDNVFEEGDHYEGHIMAVYHQLHCLSIIMTAMGTSREEWAMLDIQKLEHRAHCVEYLRQSILCSADTTLEGETGAWARSTGWGQTHSCVDLDALTAFANEKASWNLTERLLPDSFDPLKVTETGDNH
ncbi:uncharacterized protein N7479_002392 [Penicillium vulpinum]|uniref:DUF3328 domain-containing protein n=1 Tax=Penicillium vulpinum TaxID=29845 RepID=A0A1V6S7P5_9EURO|nr:uncharacterized protein N7479_002392 [Penicillium vulpinum]KAJ5972474.1 hypothetical protein N7479_002392 [Penicillium vulpinum]OQE09866.1 hypothetical protein PENVUL_c005G08422 [Penicillium vulpinum]